MWYETLRTRCTPQMTFAPFAAGTYAVGQAKSHAVAEAIAHGWGAVVLDVIEAPRRPPSPLHLVVRGHPDRPGPRPRGARSLAHAPTGCGG